MSKYIGKLRIEEEAYTIGQLKEALADLDDNLKLCFVQSTGVASKIESIEFIDEGCENIDTDGLFAPFDFELKDDVLYVPVYDGNIISFIKTENKN